eukprot:4384781-Pleurochrysis_carterae.AAC.1
MPCREGPEGVPGIADFARDTQTSERPRFNPDANESIVKGIIEALPTHFAPADKYATKLYHRNSETHTLRVFFSDSYAMIMP